jgi:hypothetical protein
MGRLPVGRSGHRGPGIPRGGGSRRDLTGWILGFRGKAPIVTRERVSEVPIEGIEHLVELNIIAFSRIRGDDLSRSMRTLIGTKRSRGGSSRRAQRSCRIKGGRKCALNSCSTEGKAWIAGLFSGNGSGSERARRALRGRGGERMPGHRGRRGSWEGLFVLIRLMRLKSRSSPLGGRRPRDEASSGSLGPRRARGSHRGRGGSSLWLLRLRQVQDAAIGFVFGSARESAGSRRAGGERKRALNASGVRGGGIRVLKSSCINGGGR